MVQQLAANLAQHLVLSDGEFLRFASFFKRRRFVRRQSLIAPGETGGLDIFVESGCLRIYSVTHDGSERILHFGIENTWWCHGALAEPSALPNIGIDALERTEVLLVDKSSKERLCSELPKFDRVFRFLTQGSLAALQQRLVLSMQTTAEARYREFTRLHPNLERRIPRYHVAAYLGICPEFFSKVRKGATARRAS